MRLLIKTFIPILCCLAAMLTIVPSTVMAEILSEQVSIDNNNLILLSSRRVTRTVSEYTLRAVAKNNTEQTIDNVKAKLMSVPDNIIIVQGEQSFGTLAGSSSVTSNNDFKIQINLRIAYSLNDLVWQIEGDLPPPPPPPPPPDPKPSQVGFFMSIDNNAIKGEVNNVSHKDWIELLAWSWGLSNSGTTHIGAGSGEGSVNLQDIIVTKFLDASSPALLLNTATGRHAEEVKIDVIKACDGNTYTQYAMTLNDVFITSVSSGGSGGEDRLTENISLNMRSIETMYTPVDGRCRLQQPIYSFQSLD
jgi:type VI secretion system secreted protein Hcp